MGIFVTGDLLAKISRTQCQYLIVNSTARELSFMLGPGVTPHHSCASLLHVIIAARNAHIAKGYRKTRPFNTCLNLGESRDSGNDFLELTGCFLTHRVVVFLL